MHNNNEVSFSTKKGAEEGKGAAKKFKNYPGGAGPAYLHSKPRHKSALRGWKVFMYNSSGESN